MNGRTTGYYQSLSQDISAFLTYVVAGVGGYGFIGWQVLAPGLEPASIKLFLPSPAASVLLIFAGTASWAFQEKRKGRFMLLGYFASVLIFSVAVVSAIGFAIGRFPLFDAEMASLLHLKAFTTGTYIISITGVLSCFLLGSALLLLQKEHPALDRIAQLFAASAGTIALVTLIGYLFSSSLFAFNSGSSHVIPLPSAVAILAGSVSILLLYPERGFVRYFIAGDVAGAAARRYLLMSVTLPLLIGGMITSLYYHGYFNAEWSVLLFAAATIVLSLILVCRNSRALRKSETVLTMSDQRLRFHRDNSPLAIVEWDSDYRITFWSREAERVFGWSSGEVVGRRIDSFGIVYKEDIPVVQSVMERLTGGKERTVISSNRNFTKAGAVIDCRWYNSVLADERGRMLSVMSFVDDITERKRTDAALERNVQRLSLLTETAAGLLQSSGPQQMIESLCWKVMAHLDCQIFFNYLVDDKIEKLRLNACFGVSDDGKKKLELLDYGVAVCGCVARDGRRFVAEHITSAADPLTDPLKALGIGAYACHPLIGEGGKVIGTLAFGTKSRETFSEDDLSLMKAVADQVTMAMIRLRHEQALSENREDLNIAQSVAHTGSWRLNVQRNELLWSDENYRIFGVSPGTLMTYEKFLTCVHPEDRAFVDREWTAALRGKSYDIEHRIIAGNVLKWVREKACLEFDGKGMLLGGFGTTQDITERKRDEETMREGETRLRLAMKAANAGTWEWELEDNTSVWSEELWRLYGLSADSFPSASAVWSSVVHPDDLEKGMLLMQETVRKGLELKMEFRVQVPNLPLRWFQTIGQPQRDSSGRVVRYIGMTQDITDLKRAEEILQRDKETLERMVLERTKELLKAQMEIENSRRLTDIGVLASTIAHEMRNPLAAIKTAAYNIERKAADASFERQLATINKKVLESDLIIQNLLNYSRVKEPQRETLPLVPLLNECIDSMLTKYAKWNVELDRQFLFKSSVQVSADPTQLRMLFSNLLDNAFQALENKTGRISVEAKEERSLVKIEIRDNGSGIEKEDMERIFEPFFTRKSRGTGLGLTICKQIVELHGGRISVASTKGAGTAIKIALPFKPSRSSSFFHLPA